jgi:hypothetical protein
MKKITIPVVLLLGVSLFSVGFTADPQQKVGKKDKHPPVDWSVSCVDCHTSQTPKAVEEWSASKHGVVGVGCFICHGDGEVEFYRKPSGAQCVACHSAQEVNFAKLPVKTCFGCHAGHTLKFHR